MLRHSTSWLTLTILALVFQADNAAAQSTYDLEPPIQADTNSTQVIMSPDPDALPVFRFATAIIDDEDVVTIATKQATQTLVAPMPKAMPPGLDPRGVKVTKNVKEEYPVEITYREEDEVGNIVVKNRTEIRNRVVRKTEYRERNAEEQVDYEKRLADYKAEQADADQPKQSDVPPAVATNVEQEYIVTVAKTVEEDGEIFRKTESERRKRNVVVYRGKTTTHSAVQSKSWPLEQLEFYDVEGNRLDAETVRNRLAEKRPVILLNSTQGITPFFEYLLNPDAMFVIEPQK